MVLDYYQREKISAKVVNIAIPDEFVEHGNVNILRHEVGIDEESILNVIGANI